MCATLQVRPAGIWIITAVVLGAFLAVDVFTGYLFGGAAFDTSPAAMVLWAGVLGICIGQLNLIAAWAALGPGNLVVRLPWTLLLTVGMWYGLVTGSRIVSAAYGRGDALLLGLVLLFGIFVAQVPLWVAAAAFGWRLKLRAEQDRSGEVPGRRPQFQLWQLLLGMFLLSLALAPGRLVLPEGREYDLELDSELFVLLGGVAVCNLVFTVPCVWAAFLPWAALGPLIIAWFAYCLLVTGLEYGAFVQLLGSPGDDETFGLMYLVNIMQCAAVLGTLLLVRAAGFELRRGRRPG